ncbi:MAG: acyl carrier protein [Ethanoligenens sp.]|uniref:acyl carrier protein n=1 Tax=Ethanoligenens sp. TaxID=2099655 RepID=UPI0039E8747D
MIRDEIIQIIKEEEPDFGPIGEKTNLYTDIGLDSLSFISLLMEIEEAYSITFDIAEMEPCLEFGHLTALVESKVKEREGQ